jgi:hypothetical protein
MNRLYLVGNGFDCAHGMPTRYSDFILWYIKSCFEEANLNGKLENSHFSIFRTSHLKIDTSTIFDIKDFEIYIV